MVAIEVNRSVIKKGKGVVVAHGSLFMSKSEIEVIFTYADLLT